MLRVILFLICALLPMAAEANDPTMPPIQLPPELRPYAHPKRVSSVAENVIGLLGTARITMSYSATAEEVCRTEKVAAVYRGMVVAQTGYNMFVNKMELDRYSVERVLDFGDKPEVSSRHFTRPERLALISTWAPAALKDLLRVAEAFRGVPDNIKGDIVSFIKYLDFIRARFDRTMSNESRKLLSLHRRGEGEYWHRYNDARRRNEISAHPDPESFAEEWPEPIYYDGESAAYRDLIDKVRDVGEAKLDPCLDGKDVGVSSIALGPKGSEVEKERYGVHPTAYAVGFWVRRHKEGTANLAAFVVKHLIEFLSKK